MTNDNKRYKLKTLNSAENLPPNIFLKSFEFVFEVIISLNLRSKGKTQFRINLEFLIL
jgi:hypothetical protein